MTISGSFERFRYFNFETNFAKNTNQDWSTRIEIVIFPYKIAVSETNVNTNRMENTKWIYLRERIFFSNYHIFSKILFQFKKNWIFSWIDVFSKVLEFYLMVLFPCEYPKLLKHQTCHHIKTSQLIWKANQLTGFYMMAILAFNELIYYIAISF